MARTTGQSEAWTDVETDKLLKLRRDGIPNKSISKKLGRSESSISSRLRECRRQQILAKPGQAGLIVSKGFENLDSVSDNEEMTSIIESAKLDVSLTADNQILNKRFNEKVRTELISDNIIRTIKALPEIPFPYTSKKPSGMDVEEMVALWSDAHFGVNFTPEEVGGLAEYNSDIACDRMRKYVEGILRIHNRESKTSNIKTLHFMALGDALAGMNESGAWSATEIREDIYEQMCIAIREIEFALTHLLGTFETIKFYGISGNHARIAKVGKEKDYATWELVMYDIIKEKFKNNPRIIFNCPKAFFISTNIQGYNFYLTHGDDAKGINSVTKLGENVALTLRTFPDYLVAGHFHSTTMFTTNCGKTLINGSMMGPDNYALKKLQKSCPAEQTVFGVHKDHGMTWRYDLRLDK